MRKLLLLLLLMIMRRLWQDGKDTSVKTTPSMKPRPMEDLDFIRKKEEFTIDEFRKRSSESELKTGPHADADMNRAGFSLWLRKGMRKICEDVFGREMGAHVSAERADADLHLHHQVQLG